MGDKTQSILNEYRELNHELTKDNQEMRINIRRFCDENLRLHAELMKKRETEAILRKLLYQSIIDNCLRLTEIVKPDADILPLLRETINSSDTCFSRVSQRSKNSNRRSIQLTEELRRSNSLINNRDSLRSTSPIRRSSANVLRESFCEDAREEELARDDEQTVSKGVIYEESECDEEEQSQYVLSSESEHDSFQNIPDIASGVSKSCETVREVTNMLDKNRNPINKTHIQALEMEFDNVKSIRDISNGASQLCVSLKDVTNMSASTTVNTQTKTIQNCRSSEIGHDIIESIPDDGVIQSCEFLRDVTNMPAKNVTDRKTHNKGQKQKTPQKLENSRGDNNSVKQKTRKKREKPLKSKSKTNDISPDDDEVQGPRTGSYGRTSEATDKSIPLSQSNNLADEVTINSIDFFEAPSSTPNKEVETSITSSRPVRKCRPTLLVEPSVRTKLRNTTATKKKKT